MGDEEFDELIEAMLGSTVQSGLVRDGVRAGHLTAASERLGDARGGALPGSETDRGFSRNSSSGSRTTTCTTSSAWRAAAAA